VPDDRWQRVKELLGAALERPAEARGAYLREACDGDDGLRREVESLLSAEGQAGDFLSEPAGGSSAAHLATGTRLGPYEIVSFLGAGGMGEVYKARDTRLDRTVAIKMLPGDFAADPERARRFEREARTISKLNHPHICALHDVGQHDGSSFLVMEYLEGESLAERLKHGPLHLADAIRCATQIADALSEAHQQGIVHRDLKPANVVLTKKGAKLLDFGIAKLRAGAVSEEAATATASELTGEGVIVGTPQYMAPEQLEGKPVDARTDVFAFGVVLYEMVTGHKAFEATTKAGLIAAILNGEPAPLSRIQPQAPGWLDRLVRRCLAKDPRARWPSCGELLAALGRGGEAQSRRRRAVLAAAAGCAVLLAVAVALWPRRAHGPAPPPVAAEIPAKSIAVLPFQNLSPDPENAYFADGMTEDVLTQLAKIQDMKVIARTSVMQYKGTTKPVREIARELGVATVLEGSVRRAGNRVRITGQLIDARTEQHLWAENYDRDLADIFAIQSEVAEQIATALTASRSGTAALAPRPPSSKPRPPPPARRSR
jgi:non-specific serine/threonine protein kinase